MSKGVDSVYPLSVRASACTGQSARAGRSVRVRVRVNGGGGESKGGAESEGEEGEWGLERR